ncbi:hypothetical protein LCGC14_1689800 [marine sediment metagenome]|uniref:Uncharacterized protein n=1 Tax=marine sediment metagenome TaxID=412755 RepID=A0A0F9K1S1_9ZZZZ|nr:MAG: hypothetical protein Lokiarch_09300 [Candidatus Lokiarchaeum sp. GC14_75]HEC38038.1 hypothetical protein [bacterium]
MPNCDWGSPCDCRECTDMHRRDICDICNKNKTIITHSQYEMDRKGMSYYEFTNYCQICWKEKKKKDEIKVKKEQEEQRKKDKKTANLETKLEKLENEPIPIKHAVIKFREQVKIANSDKWIRNYIIRSCKDILKVEKTRNRWYCCKNRLNAMDFKLFFL